MSRTDPKLNQIVNPIEDKKVQVSRPLLKGFWYLDRFSTKARSIIVGTLTNESTPSSLIGITLRILKVGKKYHSGRISIGVAKGLAGSPIDWVSTIPNANEIDIVPKIQTGNMYRMSFGQAGSPYKLCPQPLENEAISSVSRCQGSLAMILLNDVSIVCVFLR